MIHKICSIRWSLSAGRAFAAATVVLFTPSAFAAGIDMRAIVVEGEQVEGVGLVTRIDNVAVNDNGQWIVEADTDHANTDADSVLLKNGGLFLREGDPIEPGKAAIDSFDAVNLNIFGDSFWNLFLDNLPIDEDSGLYFNSTLVIQESDTSTAGEFSEGTPYLGFFETKFTDDPANVAIVLASVDDPNIPSTVDQAIVRIQFDPDNFEVDERVLAKEGDILAGTDQPVTDFETNPHTFAFSNAEDVIFLVDIEGDAAVDTIVYLNDQPVAREGFPSPVEGVNWAAFGTNTRVDVNSSADWFVKGRLDTGNSANDDVIVVNGEVLIREGDEPPGIGGGFAITSFGTSPVLIDERGSVLWFADWDDSNTDIDSALFLDDAILIREGVTDIDGRTVDEIRSVQDAFGMSPSGRFIIVEILFTTGQEAAVLIEIPSEGAPAELTGFEIITGALLEGELGDLLESDDGYVRTRSGFGETIVDLHKLEMAVDAVTAVDAPASLTISVEARIDEESGVAGIFLFNWTTGEFDQIDSYTIGMKERTRLIEVTDGAGEYVNDSGEIVLFVKHVVFVPFLAFTFESFIDFIEIVVN